jgi:hypothetical protein
VSALTYATPFVVSNLGFVAARRRNIERLAALLTHDDKAEPETPTTPCSIPRIGPVCRWSTLEEAGRRVANLACMIVVACRYGRRLVRVRRRPDER